MTTTAPAPARPAVTLALDLGRGLDAPGADVVLAAAAQLFGPDAGAHLALVLDREPVEDDGVALVARLLELVPRLEALPPLELVGPDEARALDATVRVVAHGDPAAVARAVALLTATAQTLQEDRTPAAPATPVTGTASAAPALPPAVLAARDAADERRRAEGPAPVRLLVPVQHLDTWGALATVVAAAQRHPRVEPVVVALDSVQSRVPGETAAFLDAAGVRHVGPEEGVAAVGTADVALLVDPYDEFRPAGLHLTDLLAAGVRIAYSPYARNISGSPTEVLRQYNTPMHNVAWRVFAASASQREMFARHCRAGAGHVRALGSVKGEWLLEHVPPADGWTTRWRFARTVLWNPHFSVGPGGWSTFLLHVGTVLDEAASRPDLGVVVRPHFRLLPDLAASGPQGAAAVARFRAACAALPNVHLDEDRDYRTALHVADVLVSDLSSLVPEFLELGRPAVHLQHAGYAGAGAEADWRADVESVLDEAGLRDVLARAATGDLRRPAVPADPRGAGARVLDAVLGDLVQEVWGRV
ncbi:hypothetical protein [Cellulomonas endophytica]|uniref:hypothetical protein n=1 Tax=Cellulomonas endophytica TaxID=2494735 RepID=UPI0010116D57|nr:hypothetical protein [Cellulomonas endophytica]